MGLFKKNKKMKLHIGCGEFIKNSWINSDIIFSKKIQIVLDARKILPFKDNSFDYIFGEHFIEHLEKDDGFLFFSEARRVLKEGGVLRLSTPNLDWVWFTHYRLVAEEEERLLFCEMINKAFYGWEHKFLYNNNYLKKKLIDAGFQRVEFFKYGESNIEDLQKLEQHYKDIDAGEIPSVIIVQAYK